MLAHRFACLVLGLLTGAPGALAAGPAAPQKPNIVFILADDLGYGDLSCYGQRVIQTPTLDRMAAEGLRFTSCYAGSTVCAPSRCCLMTGLHSGHARIRGNALVPLEPGDLTVAELLQHAGYHTAIIGKWGLGEPGTAGIPIRKGFHDWFGYLNQKHAHNYYPDYLWRNLEKVPLPNVVSAGVATKRVVYSQDLFTQEALRFLDQHKAAPFFLYLAYTAPHANNEAGRHGMEVPDYGIYANRPWPEPEKGRAAMISRLDSDVERVLARIRQLGLDEKTIVFFASDNGPHREGGSDPEFFHSSGPLRGLKRSLHEGGIRVPMVVRWPGKVAPGTTSNLPWAFWDFLPTAAELAGCQPPQRLDGISVVPAILGHQGQPQHQWLYWEFHEGGSSQAVRTGPWKAIRPWGGHLQLYNLQTDLGESSDVSQRNPDLVAAIEAYLATARTESPDWPLRAPQKQR